MTYGNEWNLPDILSPSRYFAGMILELVIAIICLGFWVLMIRKAFEKKHKIPTYLSISYFGFLIMLLSTLIEKILVTQTLFTYNDVVYDLKLGIFGGIGAQVFVFTYSMFVYEVFYNEKAKMEKLLKIYSYIAMIILVYAIVVFILPVSNDTYDLLFIPIAISLILMLIPICILATIAAIILVKKLSIPENSEDRLHRISIITIALNSFTLFLFTILYGIDIAVPIFGMTVLYFIAWILMALAFIFGYIGYFHPKWIIKYLKNR